MMEVYTACNDETYVCIFHRYCRTVACGRPDFPETNSGQAENDIVSLASSFLMVQVFRFGFTGGKPWIRSKGQMVTVSCKKWTGPLGPASTKL